MEVRYQFAKNGIWINHMLDERPDPAEFRMHAHTVAELFYFISGNGVFHIEGTEYLLRPDDILLMRPRESHYIELKSTAPYERVVISFPLQLFETIDAEGRLTEPFLRRDSGKLNLYKSYEFTGSSTTHYINGILSCSQDDYLGVLSHFLPLLNEIRMIFPDKTEDSVDDTLEYRIIRYINQNIHTELSLEHLCKKFAVSKQYLCSMFKKSTGATVWQYITAKRVITAHQLLAKGAKATSVFSQVGFNDYSSFYRAYVKHFSASPSQLGSADPLSDADRDITQV